MVSSVVKSGFGVTTRPSEQRDYYCTDCQQEVVGSTKHCNQCKICIDKFDHHCVWLNLCIGRRNYKLFIATLLSTTGFLTYTLLYSALVCLPANEDDNFINSSPYLAVAMINCQNLKDIDRKALLISNIIVDGIVTLLLIQLLCFHAYLTVKGMTTYEFIVRNRVKPAKKLQHSNESRPAHEMDANLEPSHHKSAASLHDGKSEGARFLEPFMSQENLGYTGTSPQNKEDKQQQQEIKKDAESKIPSVFESSPKEMMLKSNPRRSGAARELKLPR